MLEFVIMAVLSVFPTCGEGDALRPTPCGYYSAEDTAHGSFIGWNGWLINFDRAPFHAADMSAINNIPA